MAVKPIPRRIPLGHAVIPDCERRGRAAPVRQGSVQRARSRKTPHARWHADARRRDHRRLACDDGPGPVVGTVPGSILLYVEDADATYAARPKAGGKSVQGIDESVLWRPQRWHRGSERRHVVDLDPHRKTCRPRSSSAG